MIMNLLLKKKRYQDAISILNKKDEEKRTVPEKELLISLEKVVTIVESTWPKNSLAMKEDEVDPMC